MGDEVITKKHVHRGDPAYRRTTTPTLQELAAREVEEIPEVPDKYKTRLWTATKIYKDVRLTEESDHFLDIMSIHYGIRKEDVILHAVNLLWKETVESITPERIKAYEDHAEAVRFERIQKREASRLNKVERKKRAMKQWYNNHPDVQIRSYGNCTTWSLVTKK